MMTVMERFALSSFVCVSVLLSAGCGTTGPKSVATTSGPVASKGAVALTSHKQTHVSSSTSVADFYVSPAGNDTNPGTAAAPFATLRQARDVVRQKVADGLTTNIAVQIRGGVYPLDEPLVFDSRDSGTEQYSITYVVPTNETALVSGGVQLTGWMESSNGLWTTTVPESLVARNPFRYLFINGKRAIRARTPDKNSATPFLRILDSKLSDDLHTWEIKLPADQLAGCTNASDMELVVLLEFITFRKRVQSINPATGVVTLMPPHNKPTAFRTPRPGMACYLENARAFLSQPGEWHLDTSSREISYHPRPGERIDQLEAYTPVLTNLFLINGTEDRPVRNLHFDRISFAHTTWILPAGAEYVGEYITNLVPNAAVIQMCGSDGCSILNCDISRAGGGGIRIFAPSRQVTIMGTTVHDVGSIGMVLCGEAPPASPGISGSIMNNDIYDCAVEDQSTDAFYADFSEGLIIRNNLVHDCPYAGICIGDRASDPALSKNNSIIANRVHHVMMLSSDGGGIYEIGRQSNCIIRGNFVTDVLRSPWAVGAPNNGIFMDDHGGGCFIVDNVVNKTAGTAIRFNCDPTKHILGPNFFGEYVFGKGMVGEFALDTSGDHFWDEPHATALDPQYFTVSTWIRPLTFASGKDPSSWLVCKNGDEMTDGHYSLLISRQNLGAYMNIGGGRDNLYSVWSHDNPIHAGEWSHVAMTYDGTDLKVYCNGRLAGVSTVNAQRTTGAGLLRIGKRSDGYAQSFSGFMDDVRLYNRALSAGEINDYYSRSSADREQETTTAPQTSGPEPANAAAHTTESGLAFHMDFTAMHDKIEAIKANAGPEEPYRSRFGGLPEPIQGTQSPRQDLKAPISEKKMPLAKTEPKDGWFMRALKFIFWILLGG